MKTKKVHIALLYVFFAFLLVVSAVFGGRNFLPAFADTDGAGALEDLQKDETFNASEYPDNVQDRGIYVIQIAESSDGKLLIYTYQPCQKLQYLVATDVNMSLTESVDATRLYALTLINVQSVFGKYVVNDVSVNAAEAKRYYNITSIFREYDPYIDASSDLDDGTKKISYAVGKLFVSETVDGKPVYSENKKDVITITTAYAGNILCKDEATHVNGYGNIYGVSMTLLYVAFDTDLPIDWLYEADVEYTRQSYAFKIHCVSADGAGHGIGEKYDEQKGEPVKERATLYSDKDIITGKYSWREIQTVDSYKQKLQENDMELTEEGQKGLEGKKWVLNFATKEAHTHMDFSGDPLSWVTKPDPSVQTEIVDNVTILRLKFEHDEKTYDLGAVSSVMLVHEKPSNTLPESGFSIPWWVWLIVAAVVLLILLPILGFIFPVFGKLLLSILRRLWWLISAPFRWIGSLIKERKNRSAGKTKSKPKTKSKSKSKAKKKKS